MSDYSGTGHPCSNCHGDGWVYKLKEKVACPGCRRTCVHCVYWLKVPGMEYTGNCMSGEALSSGDETDSQFTCRWWSGRRF